MRTRFHIILGLVLIVIVVFAGVTFAQFFPGNAPMCYRVEESDSHVIFSFESNAEGYSAYGLLFVNGEFVDYGDNNYGDEPTELRYDFDPSYGNFQDIFMMAWYSLPEGVASAGCGDGIILELGGSPNEAQPTRSGPIYCYFVNPENWTEDQIEITGQLVQISIEEKVNEEGIPGTVIQVIFEQPGSELNVNHTILIDGEETGEIHLVVEDLNENGISDVQENGAFSRCTATDGIIGIRPEEE